jgi:hypothetical protein
MTRSAPDDDAKASSMRGLARNAENRWPGHLPLAFAASRRELAAGRDDANATRPRYQQ